VQRVTGGLQVHQGKMARMVPRDIGAQLEPQGLLVTGEQRAFLVYQVTGELRALLVTM